MESNTQSYDNVYKINVGGKVFEIKKKNLKKFPESELTIEAICSGRHQIETVDGIPFIEKDPLFFEK